MKTIYDFALQCRTFIDQNIKIEKKKIINRISNLQAYVFYDYDISGNADSLLTNLKQLNELLESKYPKVNRILETHIDTFAEDTIIHLSAIQAILDFIIAIEEKPSNCKKVFISHSSKDKGVMQSFVDNILQLGIGIQGHDIFCTSIEDMAVRNGEDIREHIHANIQCADYSFLMISKNYKESEICLNEMGAVWAYNSNVRLFLLPNTDYSEIGWLCEPQKACKIDDPTALDSLCHEMTQFFSLPLNYERWSRQRTTFCEKLNHQKQTF